MPDAPIFLYYFLPAVLVVFFGCPRPARPWVLLAASLLYAFLADAAGLPVLLGAAVGNFLLGRAIGRAGAVAASRLTGLGVAANLAVLAWYKYVALAAPLGISFFTFQAVAYLIDVKRGTIPAEQRLVRFSTALTFFPKFTAGPIARFGPLLADLGQCRPRLEHFREGAWRFTVGLAKKSLIAGTLAPLVDTVFARPDLDMARSPRRYDAQGCCILVWLQNPTESKQGF